MNKPVAFVSSLFFFLYIYRIMEQAALEFSSRDVLSQAGILYSCGLQAGIW